MRAKARRHQPGQMNKNEAAYQRHLEQRQHAGEIVRYRFEPVKFRLADLAYYMPDFEVQLPDGTLEFHEVKPSYRQKLKAGTRREVPFCFEDAKLKIRIAVQFDEFTFVIVFPLKAGGWGRVEFGRHATKEAQIGGIGRVGNLNRSRLRKATFGLEKEPHWDNLHMFLCTNIPWLFRASSAILFP